MTLKRVKVWKHLRSWVQEFNQIAELIHDWAIEKGHWEGEPSDGEKIALMHSELSEALEGLRHGNPPNEDCPEFSSVEIELADAVIRIMDFGAARNWDIAGALLAKMEFNESRPYKHGKKF